MCPDTIGSIDRDASECWRRRSLLHVFCLAHVVPATTTLLKSLRLLSQQPTSVIAATALSGAPRIGEAVWTSAVESESNAPIALAPQATDETIFAVFPIESLPAGSQLIASWFFNDTSLDALDSAMRIDRDRVAVGSSFISSERAQNLGRMVIMKSL